MVLTIIMFSRAYEIEFSKNASYVRVRNWLLRAWLEDILNTLEVFLQNRFASPPCSFWLSVPAQDFELDVHSLEGGVLIPYLCS